MLDSKKFIAFPTLLFLISCGGGGVPSSSSPESFTIPPKVINGLLVDGYIRNAEIWLETSDDFSSLNELKTSSDNQGRFSFSTNQSNFRIQSSGGVDLDTGSSLEGLILINHRIDEIESTTSSINKTWDNYIVSPLTTADFFLAESLLELSNPISPSVNQLLGLDISLNLNITDHVENLDNGFKFAETYEKANQLTVLALSVSKFVNNLNASNNNTNEAFKVILDELVSNYQISETEINLESAIFIEGLIERIIAKFSLTLSTEVKAKIKNIYKSFIPLIQIKPDISVSQDIFAFATNTFVNDVIAVSSNKDFQNIYSRYNNDLVVYLSEVTGQSEASLAFSITANPDSISSFEDQTYNIDVLQNDDFDNQSNFNITFSQPLNGTITKNSSNVLAYQPNENFNGSDSFSYTLQQGSLSSSSSVTINVQPLPDAPVISISSSQITVTENESDVTTIIASDADGDSLSFSLSGVDASYFSISSIGELKFINPPDYEEKTSYLLTVTVSDGTLTDSVNLNISITNIAHEIDLLVYYAPDMLSFYSSEANVETRVLYLITSANNALTRSESEIQFNLLKLLPYDVDVSNQSGNTIFSSLVGREKIKKDQVLYGADYFILLSRWDTAKGNTGGTANIDLSIDNILDWDYAHGYLSAWSVDPNWSEAGCNPCFPDKVFAHELGHNLGSGHWPGDTGQSYAYGHRVDGNTDGDFTDIVDWGTVMSYNDISPDYFSNPNIVCKNDLACGVINVSDNTKWYNNLGVRFSNILPASSLDNSNSSNKISIKNYFPKIDGGSSIFSNAGISRTFTLIGFADKELSGQTYKSFKWEDSSNSNQIAYYFYEKDNKYFINRTDYEGGYKFSNRNETTLYDDNNLCIFFESFQSPGNYLSRSCKNAIEGDPAIYRNVYHFNHFIKNETVTVPYGSYETVKYVFSIWDNNIALDSVFRDDIPYLMHTIFWMNPEVGIVQYRDHLGRIWKLESTDTDGDGADNKLDSDDDNDGVVDNEDAFKLDPDASIDSNLDGVPD